MRTATLAQCSNQSGRRTPTRVLRVAVAILTGAWLVPASQASGASPVVEDISPERPNGVVDGGISTAGLISGLAGTADNLYAVSPNGGVWKAGAGGPWQQLNGSPAHAASIAASVGGVVVGERNGEGTVNDSGLWSSTGGTTWARILDPLTLGCPYQAVPAVVLPGSNTFAATSCGIAGAGVGISGPSLVRSRDNREKFTYTTLSDTPRRRLPPLPRLARGG